MFWKLVAIAVAQTVLFALVYTVWRAADRVGEVACKDRMPFWEYNLYQLLVDLAFLALACLAVLAVYGARRFVIEQNPDWGLNKELLKTLLKYSSACAVARFLSEAVKSFVNYEKYLYDTLPPGTAAAIRRCKDESDGEESEDGDADNARDGCPLSSDDLEAISPGIGAKGLASRPRALARHAIRQSLVHWIAFVYLGLGAIFTWGMIEYLALLSARGVGGGTGPPAAAAVTGVDLKEETIGNQEVVIDDGRDNNYDDRSLLQTKDIKLDVSSPTSRSVAPDNEDSDSGTANGSEAVSEQGSEQVSPDAPGDMDNDKSAKERDSEIETKSQNNENLSDSGTAKREDGASEKGPKTGSTEVASAKDENNRGKKESANGSDGVSEKGSQQGPPAPDTRGDGKSAKEGTKNGSDGDSVGDSEQGPQQGSRKAASARGDENVGESGSVNGSERAAEQKSQQGSRKAASARGDENVGESGSVNGSERAAEQKSQQGSPAVASARGDENVGESESVYGSEGASKKESQPGSPAVASARGEVATEGSVKETSKSSSTSSGESPPGPPTGKAPTSQKLTQINPENLTPEGKRLAGFATNNPTVSKSNKLVNAVSDGAGRTKLQPSSNQQNADARTPRNNDGRRSGRAPIRGRGKVRGRGAGRRR